ncbi:MAG: methyltransferase domain-containing protein [Candidatus Manganitrophaceae bacterium]
MIKAVFDKSAQTYDRARQQLIPCFDEFYDAVITQIAYPNHAKLRVLDLGAGTGLLSLFISRRFPYAKITLLDLSEAMLKKARERFADQPGYFDFIVADYVETPFSGLFDAVISALSIHHLKDERKTLLFRKISDVLVDGGVFINADQVLGSTPEIERRYRQVWLRQVRERGVSDEDLAAALDRMKEDRMATLESQLKWLKEAGFREVDCWYRSYNFAVFGGCK